MNSFLYRTIYAVGVLIIVVVFTYGYYVTHTIPKDFPIGKSFIVEEDETLHSVSLRLENEHYIGSALWFRAWVSLLGRDRRVQLGEFVFTKPLVLGAVVKKLVLTKPDMPLVSVTVPEGSTSSEVAMIIKKELPNFSVDIFNKKVTVNKANGKLFPSTYFLLPSTSEERILTIMTKTFDNKYAENFKYSKMPTSLNNEEEVIVLASILEGEAKTKEDMQIVAGILLKRISLNMLLQVDVAKETYKIKGLPKEPLDNPGIISLFAALNPIKTDYLYYLTGKDGTMHYAKTFAEHKQNIKKYLK